MRCLLLLLALAMGPAALAQATVPSTASATLLPDDRTEAERAVAEILAGEGVHVVRFWAPWCHNSMNELKAGLYDGLIEDHPDVTFTFVTVRNRGEDGQSTLDRFDLPDRVTVLAEQNRDPLTFLGLPITWTPTTWIFNREGKLAYAFNYGEVTPALLTQAIADAHHHWHD